MPGLVLVKQDGEPAALSAVSDQILFLTFVLLSFTQLSGKLRTLKCCLPAADCRALLLKFSAAWPKARQGTQM